MKLPFKKSFSKRSYVLLVDNEPINIGDKKAVDVILSPKYYWVKKEKLPVRYAYQAKAYAPSSFEGAIPKGHYSYLVQKDDEGFLLYAYDDSFIINELEKLGLKPSQIKKVYFAQSEFKHSKKPVKVNANEVLTNHDGMIIKVPKQMAKECIDLAQFFSTNHLTNFHVNLNKFSKIIDFKKAYIIAGVLGFLTLFYMIEFFWLGSVRDEQAQKKQNIIKTYKMPATSLQANALMKNLDKTMNAQLAVRDKFYALTKNPLKKGEFFNEISFNAKRFKLNLTLQNEARIQEVQKYLQKHFKMDNVIKKGKNVIFEVHYD